MEGRGDAEAELSRVGLLARMFYEGGGDASRRRELEGALGEWTNSARTWAQLGPLLAAVRGDDHYALFFIAQAVLHMSARCERSQWARVAPELVAQVWRLCEAQWAVLKPWVRNKLCTAVVLGSARGWGGGETFPPLRVGLTSCNVAGLALLRFSYECCVDCLPDREQAALTHVLRAGAKEVGQVCAQALAARPCQEEAPQVLLAVLKVELAVVAPVLPLLWNGLCASLPQQTQEASAIAILAVLADVFDCNAATVMGLGPGGEFAGQFAMVHSLYC
jgi:hypothetical protein